MPDAVVPHVVTPEQAADALGITLVELARNLQVNVCARLRKLSAEIDSYQVTDLESFDDAIANIRRLYESTVAVWAASDADPPT